MPAFIGATKSLHEDMAALLEEVPTGPGPHPESTNFSDITLVFTEPNPDKTKEMGGVRKFRVHRYVFFITGSLTVSHISSMTNSSLMLPMFRQFIYCLTAERS